MNKLQPQIVFESKDILVVNKPYGLITHPKNAADTQPSLTGWVAENYPELENIGEPFIASGSPLPRYGIVHRLDKDTSGLIIIAKNEKSFAYMKNQFQTHAIKKQYAALVHGRPQSSSGTIALPLGRIGMKRTTRILGKKMLDRKEAETEYDVAAQYGDYTLLNVRPKTGRTHQIRVHLKSIGLPVAGDPVYGPNGRTVPRGLHRLFLHAQKLSFVAPDGQSLTLEADLPEDLKAVLVHLEKNKKAV